MDKQYTPLNMLTEFDYLMEDSEVNGRKTKSLRGILSSGWVGNKNKRKYPTPLLERELNKLYPDIRSRKLLGELDHPSDLKIHLDKVSHLITEAQIEDNNVVGKIEILTGTPAGDLLMGLVNNKVAIGISSRAGGSTVSDREGFQVVQEDFMLLTWDVVAQPSNYSSWLSLVESISWNMDKGTYGETIQRNKQSSLEKILDGNLFNKSGLKQRTLADIFGVK